MGRVEYAGLLLALAGSVVIVAILMLPLDEQNECMGRTHEHYLDGARIYPKAIVYSGDHKQTLEFVEISKVIIPLDKKEKYFWKTRQTPSGDLAIAESGHVVAASAEALLNMPAAMRSTVRSLIVDHWNPSVQAALQQSSILAITVFDGVDGDDAVLTINGMRESVKALQINLKKSVRALDLSEVNVTPSLRLLRIVGHLNGRPLVFSQYVSAFGGLRFLGLVNVKFVSKRKVSGQAGHGGLSGDDWYCNSGLSVVGRLKELKILTMNSCGLTSLESLRGNRTIECLAVPGNPLERLPLSDLPELRLLDVSDTGIPRSAVDLFVEVNPRCRTIFDSRTESFQRVVEGSDRIVVGENVSLGLKRLNLPENDRVLFTLRKPDEVQKVLTSIQVARRSWGGILVRMRPQRVILLSFYRYDRHLATLEVHYGSEVIWRSGPWQSPTMLAFDGQASLGRMLESHGIMYPSRRRLADMKAVRVRDVLLNARRQVLKGVEHSDSDLVDPGDVIDRITESDGEELAISMVMHLLGCVETSWGDSGGYDGSLRERLDDYVVGPERYRHLVSLVKDPMARKGLASWLLNEDRWRLHFSAFGGNTWLRVVARVGLEHPQQVNRLLTLRMLGDMKEAQATSILRGVLRGEYRVRDFSSADLPPVGQAPDEIAGGLFVNYRSSLSIAALLLAQRKDRSSLRLIESRLSRDRRELSDSEREALGKAVRRLRSH